VRRVSSRQNPLVARFRAAALGEADGVLLLDGVHLVADALNAGIRIRDAAVVVAAVEGTATEPDVEQLIDQLSRAGVEPVLVTAPVMAALSPVRSPSSIVALADRPVWERVPTANTPPLVVVGVDVQDPGNVGAIVRVAEAGGATAAVIAGTSADPFGWKALRGSMGSALRLPVTTSRDAAAVLAELRRHGHRAIGTAPRGGRVFTDIDYTKPTAVFIGGEGQGLPDMLLQQMDERVTIPMQAPVESLNAAATTAIIVYEALRQRTASR
jgi:TrmH family RNA methyltransferase